MFISGLTLSKQKLLGPKFCLAFAALFLALSLNACSALKAAPAPTTPFLEHGDKLHAWHNRAPWDAVWSTDPGKIMAKSDVVRKIYLAPVNIQYLNMEKNEKDEWVCKHNVPAKDVNDITSLMEKSFKEAIQTHPEANLQLVENPGPGVLTLSLSLVELRPTKVLLNTVADVGTVLVPGSKALEEAGAVGAQAAGGAIAAGTIAIEIKLIDGDTGQSVAEAKDREADPASILPNYRDFEEYGWSRRTVKEWAKQFVDIFSTSAKVKVSAESDISLVPW